MHCNARTWIVVAAATIASSVFAPSSIARTPNQGVALLGDRAGAKAEHLPAHAQGHSGVEGRLNAAALSAPTLEVTFADGQSAIARLQRVAQDDAKGTRSWIGTFDDSPGSVLVLTRVKGVVSGIANYKDATLEILPVAGGRHVLFAVDGRRVPERMENDTINEVADASSGEDDFGTGGSTVAAGSDVVHDVLVVYTAAAAASVGAATLEGMILNAVQAGNQAFRNSNVYITFNVVGLQQVSMTESGSGMGTTLTNLRDNPAVRSLRDKLAADVVVLVSQDSDGCGKAGRWYPSGTVDAYSVVYSICLSNQSLAHEIGHLQSIDHNREDGSGGAYPYSFGYRVCASNGFRDVMSYPCPSVNLARVLQHSNPSVYYNGYATGVSYELSPSTSADNARTLNNTATTVAAYRIGSSSTGSAPAAPTALAASSIQYDRVSLTWSDTSANEIGFKLERSRDGVTYTEIASLGANSRSFTDAAVAAATRYYYRVRAYNGTGPSAYSDTLTVATPNAPVSPPAPTVPAAPTNVNAANGGNGTAIITWGDASNNETSFEIRRAKWDRKARTWQPRTRVGSVGANATRLVDRCGNGTYRYFVRAMNASGGSAYSGPGAVTVTGGGGR